MNGKSNFWNMQIHYYFRSLIAFFAGFLILATLYISRETNSTGSYQNKRNKSYINSSSDEERFRTLLIHPKGLNLSVSSSCNLHSGRWVFDNKSEPPYSSVNCTFIDDGMACEKFGRKNMNYQYWRWQPYDCDLPRFNAIALLQMLRNKRVVFVGDSLNRNQWVSMVCLLESNVPPSLKFVHYNGSLVTFKATEFNATVDFYWSPVLVESNCDDPSHHRVPERIMKINAIEKHAEHWSDADVLIFNSYLWWRWPNLKVLSGSLTSKDVVYEDVEMLHGYEMALHTWSEWLDAHVNRSRTKVFFTSSSPTHNRAEEWGKPELKNCYNETEPVLKGEYWGRDSDARMMRLVEGAIDKLRAGGVKVQMLNITQLSDYRKEAHSSIYRKQWDPLTEEQLQNPSTYADCTHWCLPGVPDVWNTMLYAYLMDPSRD
ncbi:hypothetical protein Leryth_025959 [Lithospermum erythrorhizon]|nr:hypothetical protein Leryth_025959 [Lithospermum erythrorhizon]